jgi:hypothetical protein
LCHKNHILDANKHAESSETFVLAPVYANAQDRSPMGSIPMGIYNTAEINM